MRLLYTVLCAAAVAAFGAAVQLEAADTRTLAPTMNTGPMKLNPNIVMQAIRIGCVVQGTPVEFPDDIVLTNSGAIAIPAGYKIKWELPGKTGLYTFVAELAPTKRVFVENAFPGGLQAGVPCTVISVN